MKSNNKVDNMISLFRMRAESAPKSILYHFSETGLQKDNLSYSYSDLEQRILSTAALIQSYTQVGDRALIIFAPGIDYVITFWACLYAGVLAVPAYPPINKNTIDKIQVIIKNAEPKVILSNTEVIKRIKRLGLLKSMSEHRLIKKLIHQFSTKTDELLQWDFNNYHWLDVSNINDMSQQWKEISPQPDDIAYLQYTSGSTALPKGVMVTHANLLANLQLVYETIGETSGERMVSWLPPYHDMGLIGNLLFPVYCDYTIMMMSPISFMRNPILWLQAISDFKGTVSGGPNFSYELCGKIKEEDLDDTLDLSHWRVAYNGAEPINFRTLDNFAKKFARYGFKKSSNMPLYGLAEATVYVSGEKGNNRAPSELLIEKELFYTHTIQPVDRVDNNKVLVSCGKPKVPVSIVSAYPHKRCKEGEIGEIWLQGSSVTQGYWNNKEETESTYNGVLEDEAGSYYLKTGDLGFILEGELYVTGRIKDLIIINGKNYYPQDIELAAQESSSEIRRGCVAAFAVQHGNEEHVALVVELNKSYDQSHYQEVAQMIVAAISLHHGISVYRISFIPPKMLPKTSSGKLRRSYTRTLISENELEPLFQWIDPRKGA